MPRRKEVAKMAMNADRIESLQAGHSAGARDNRMFAEVVREQDGALYVDCGWVVPEADEDDHASSGRHPFKDGRARPWVGRRVGVGSAQEAVDLLQSLTRDLWSGKLPADGERIGSVHR